MRLPQKKKPGDPVLAADWNLLLEAIEARTPRSGAGLELMSSSGGFCYSVPPAMADAPKGLPAFSVIGIARDGGNYQVTIREGWVIERKPKDGDTPVVKFHMPKSGGTALDAIPRPQIAMVIGDTLWCKYETDATGEITGTPGLIVAADEPTGTHYQPANPEDSGDEGTDGVYHVKLFKLEDGDGTPTVKVYQQSDIEHWAQLWTAQNTGDGVAVCRGFHPEDNVHRFRTIMGINGINVQKSGDDEVIEVGLDSAYLSHLDLIIRNAYYSGYVEGEDWGGCMLRWRHGLYVGRYDAEAGPLEGDDQLVIAITRVIVTQVINDA
ncbi:MAG: hypothetical protein WCJ13_10285 [Coriobacteriia bacterium]